MALLIKRKSKPVKMGKLIKRKPKEVKMGKLLKRKPNIREKFKKAQVRSIEQQFVNKESEAEEFRNKIIKSYIWPIIKEFYIVTPIISSSRKTPYYMKSGFKRGVAYIRKAIRGTLYEGTEFEDLNRKFTVDEILDSVMTHKLALTPDYKPVDKKYLRVNLDQFFLNIFSKSIGKSFFLYWMNNDPLPVVKLCVDAYPDITEEIIRLFEWKDLSYEDINHVIKGVEVFRQVFATVTISPVFNRSMIPKKLAEILWMILTDVFETFQKPVIPRYMESSKYRGWVEKGLLESDYVI